MKLVNPLHYPLPVLVAAIMLVVGVRWLRLPSAVMLPLAGITAVAGAALRQTQEPEPLQLNNPALESELQTLRQQANRLVHDAAALRLEATQLLSSSAQLDLLATIQLSCDRVTELPAKIDRLIRQMQGSRAVLSLPALQQQLATVEGQLDSSSGVMRQQLSQLASSLHQNIQLAQEGQDVRHAQVAQLSTLMLNSAGVLQQLQNQLHTVNLQATEQTVELQRLSEELNSMQASVTVLTHSPSKP